VNKKLNEVLPAQPLEAHRDYRLELGLLQFGLDRISSGFRSCGNYAERHPLKQEFSGN
jgi:hypothetical protein